MMEEPPYDDDNLINDYNEEEFPEEYEPDNLEQEEQEQNVELRNEEIMHLNVPSEDIEMTEEHHHDEVPVSVMVSHTEALDRDLYNFERYEGSKRWRQETQIEKQVKGDVMEAVKWKNASDDLQQQHYYTHQYNSGVKSKTYAPESQLVQFLASDYMNTRFSYLQKSDRFKIRSSSTIPIENVETIPVTLSNGSRYYINSNLKATCYALANGSAEVQGSLLGITMDELNRRAEVFHRKKDRSRKKLKVRHGHEEVGDDNIQMRDDTDKLDDGMDRLWVDKHAPAHFSDLLSDERINREVLRALRQWDPYVFGKNAPSRPTYFQDHNRDDTHNTKDKIDIHDKRPDERNRVILLSGPPGVGKTTLAHIIAKHAGYRPLEVNASDERSAAVLTDRVTRAMESSTLKTSTNDPMAGRPNCLILDEIDGADAKKSINAILNIIRAEKPTKSSKKKGKITYLRRPIIFICNHKHAPALKPLLPFAKQFDVQAPLASRLVSRLKAILSSEHMAIVGGSSLLHQLVDVSGGDIRSCLYTLQFAAARAREIAAYKRRNDDAFDPMKSTVDISLALAPSIGGGKGIKDERSDFTCTLNSIFRKFKKGQIGDVVQSNQHRDVERVLECVDCFGDNSKTLDSLFLNILSVSYVDPTLDRCWTAHEWLSSVDMYRSHKSSVAMNNSMEHRTMQKFHIPTAAAAIHLLCRVETKPDLVFSMRYMMDASFHLEAHESLVNKFLEGLSPFVRSGSQRNNIVSDVIPYCMWLLSAGNGNCALNRPASSFDILTQEEKAAFETHVSVLRSLGLTYVFSDQGEYSDSASESKMRLEPEIDKLSDFRGLKTTRGEIPHTMKELLAHATTVASLKELSPIENFKKKPQVPIKASLPPPSESVEYMDATEQMPVILEKEVANQNKNLNFLGMYAAKAKAAKTARMAANVGFDRSKNRKMLSNSGSGLSIDEVLRYKYQKGFTQAVRLPCTKQDLLL